MSCAFRIHGFKEGRRALPYVFEFINPINKHVLMVYYVPGIILANGGPVLIKKINIPALMELTFW